MKEKNIKPGKNNSNLYQLEYQFWNKNQLVCGVDEVGRGCLAGPIVTAALILNRYATHPELKDSKLLSSRQLENIYTWIIKNSRFAIGISNARIIDQKNIYITTQITMKKALYGLLQSTPYKPSLIAIDAMPLHMSGTPYETIALESWIKGESKSASIAAASIVAKVTRDRIMQKMNAAFPAYGLCNHKGYGTAAHIAMLKQHQATVIHRQTFIKNFIQGAEHATSQQQNLFC